MKNFTLITVLILLFFPAFGQEFPVVKQNFFPKPASGGNVSFVAHNKVLYVANKTAAGGRLFQYDGAWKEITTVNSGILSTNINNMVAFDGRLFLATDEGISIKDGSNWTSYTHANSDLSYYFVYSITANDKLIAVSTDEGISYKLHSAKHWVNLSYTSLGLRGYSQSLLKDQIAIQGSYIYVSTWLIRATLRINWESAEFRLIEGDVSSGIAFHDTNTFLCLSKYNSLRQVFDTSLGPMIGNGNWLTDHSWMNRSVFTDKFGKIWVINPDKGKVTLNTLKNGKYLGGYFAIPVSTQIGDSTILAYDNVTDSVYSLNDNIAFSMNDVRNPKESFRPDMGFLDINRISTPVSYNGTVSGDIDFGNRHFEAPKGENTYAIFSSGLWIGGLDDDDNLHMAAMTYRQHGDDFWPAPLDPVTGKYNPQDSERFARVWKVNKSDVQKHINLYGINQVVKESQTAEAIWNWPGNRTVGSADSLAPFVDQNGNGIYEPGKGDYPDFPGDQCIFWVMNDMAHPHGETGGVPLGVEIQGLAYAFSCDDLSSNDPKDGINYTTFYRYKIINQSDSDYKNVTVGMFHDPDLGYYGDDFVGCHVTENMGYCYNGDPVDEGIKGYDTLPPMISSVILNAPSFIHDQVDGDGDGLIDEDDEKRFMGHFMSYQNSFTTYGNPYEDIHYYNYLNGLWKNGDCITADYKQGQTGVNCTSYLYSDTTDPSLSKISWTEPKVGNLPSDRRFLTSSFPFSLSAKQSVDFEFALVYSRDLNMVNQLPKNISYVKAVKDWYYKGSTPSCYKPLSLDEVLAQGHAKIYPVPTTSSITIETESNIKAVQIIDLNGRMVGKIKPDKNIRKLEVSLLYLNAGIYFVQTSTETGTLTNRILRL